MPPEDDTSVEVETVTAGDGGPRTRALAGRTGDRYQLGATIGAGGMGEIVTAHDTQIGRDVAVKRMLRPQPSDRAMGRFFREACIQGRLDHPAIVPVHELGVDEGGRPFFVMKKLAGETLGDRIADRAPRQRLLRAFADVCLAVELAHTRGILHRDLKPANIVLGDFGEVYVLDWGVAKDLTESVDIVATRDPEHSPEPLTVDGAVIGTPLYMSPEQARGALDLDARTDVYSLGCILFEILTGDVMNRRRAATHADIPPELHEVCVAATAHDRAARTATARQLAEQVERFLDGDRDLALRRKLAETHLANARAAFAAGNDQRTAMREAGRALALDPELIGPAELVGRLMLEPPLDTPPAVTEQIANDNMAALRRQARAGALGYLGYLAFLPALVGKLGYGAGLVALIALNSYFLLAEPLFARLRLRMWLVAIANAALIAFLAHLGSPLLMAPAVASIGTMALVFSPTYARLRNAVAVSAGMLGGILLAWVAELAGWVPATMTLDATHFEIAPPIMELSLQGRYVMLALFVLAVIGAALGIGHANRRVDIDSRRRLHLQAWQLRQLVSG